MIEKRVVYLLTTGEYPSECFHKAVFFSEAAAKEYAKKKNLAETTIDIEELELHDIPLMDGPPS